MSDQVFRLKQERVEISLRLTCFCIQDIEPVRSPFHSSVLKIHGSISPRTPQRSM